MRETPPDGAKSDRSTTLACPKHMTFGPCGGVGADGSCEVADVPCSFLGVPTVRWRDRVGVAASAGPAAAVSTAAVSTAAVTAVAGASASAPVVPQAERMRALLAVRPVVVADLPSRPMDSASIAECAAALVGGVDAVLLGDAPASRVQFPPAYRAVLVRRSGLAVWAGVNDRDRNRVAIEGELAALADADVAAVHCVTGDHPASGHRADALPVFDLDSTQTAALARRTGHLVSVAEAPLAPPRDRRPARLREKERAGAEVCFVDHCGGAGVARGFVDRARDLGSTAAFLGCVPVVVDAGSARTLASFPGLVLPDGFLDRILEAADPRRTGIDLATDEAERMLAAGLGVNLSGGAGEAGHLAFAEALAEIAQRLGVVR